MRRHADRMRRAFSRCSCTLFAHACSSLWLPRCLLVCRSPLLSSSLRCLPPLLLRPTWTSSETDGSQRSTSSGLVRQRTHNSATGSNRRDLRQCAALCAAVRGCAESLTLLCSVFFVPVRYRSVSGVQQDSVLREIRVSSSSPPHMRAAAAQPQRCIAICCSSVFFFFFLPLSDTMIQHGY